MCAAKDIVAMPRVSVSAHPSVRFFPIPEGYPT